MADQKKHVIIVAGGTGSRMDKETPKQMLMLGDRPVIIHTMERFLAYDPEINIVVVLHQALMEDFMQTLTKYNFRSAVTLVKGGETRFNSVKNGLEAITMETGVVGIHDAARPLVSIDTISRAFDTAAEKGNGIPSIAMAESIRYCNNEGNSAVPRSRYKIIQTPQCFQLHLIKNAFRQEYKPEFTDDATVLESTGEKINLVEGNSENIKLTLQHDMKIAEALLPQFYNS
jgi:2-C-methyl-D-erythritol 4-phosphate cytidylyltransferase